MCVDLGYKTLVISDIFPILAKREPVHCNGNHAEGIQQTTPLIIRKLDRWSLVGQIIRLQNHVAQQ